MPNIIDTFLLHAAVDSVGIFDQNLKQVFPRARPLKALVKEPFKLMDHPLESGAITTDHRIILQIEIELSLVLQAEDYLDTYRQIKQAALSSTLFVVQTQTGIYKNQVIASVPHQEDPDQFNTIMMALTFRQVQFVTPSSSLVPKYAADTSTVDRGQQQPQLNTPPAGSAANTTVSNSFK